MNNNLQSFNIFKYLNLSNISFKKIIINTNKIQFSYQVIRTFINQLIIFYSHSLLFAQ
jgi:hypothetical protein